MYERAIDVDHRNITVWLKYAEMEMRHKQINHARNIWDRAVTILPRANQFWYKYSYMEEMLGNVAGARQVRKGGEERDGCIVMGDLTGKEWRRERRSERCRGEVYEWLKNEIVGESIKGHVQYM